MLDLITNPDDPKSIEYATFKYDFWDSNADWSVIAPSFPAVNAYGVFNSTLIRDVASYDLAVKDEQRLCRRWRERKNSSFQRFFEF